MPKEMHQSLHDLTKFTQTKAMFTQRIREGQVLTKDAELPYVYISKQLYADLGKPHVIRIVVEAWNDEN